MSKSSTPTWAEQLQVMRLLADVAALRGDPPAQRQHLTDGLNALLRTRSGWFYVADGFKPGLTPSVRHRALGRDPDPAFMRAAAATGNEITIDAEPYGDHVLHDDRRLQTWSRARVLSHPDARRRYAGVLALEDAARVVDGSVAVYRDGPAGERVVGVALHRVRGEGKLRPREHALLAFAVRELRDLAARGHLPLGPAAPPGLPPRLRQVLDRLVRGDGVKQVARELGLSVWTVREHVQRLYRHFGVNSREELTARFVGR
ncbi:MAG TPA: LuxR C-terminal-related transcriptional regulator [Humisphaera sp.]